VKAANTNTAAISSINGTSAGTFTVDLDSNMIPIVNKADDGTYPINWCNYDAKQWCNAVTLVNNKALNSYDQDGTRHTDQTGAYTPLQYYRDYAPAGTIIAEADILGYWTYIPRYAYQVTRYNATNDNTGYQVQTPFNIIFQKKTDTKCVPTAYTGTGRYDGQGYNNSCNSTGTSTRWATHPAFSICNKDVAVVCTDTPTELNGFWYGKFESSRSDGYSCSATSTTDVCNTGATINAYGTPLNTASLYATIKPNKSPATLQRVSSQYLSAKYIKTAHNFSSDSSLNAHLSTNNHWGAAAYLSTSTYGVGDETCADADCSSNYKKVYNNGYYGGASFSSNQLCSVADSSATTATGCRYVTGAGPSSSHTDSGINTTLNQYHTTIGQEASTTGNVYGIYDMAGGVAEYQMGVYANPIGIPMSGNSAGFNSGFIINGDTGGTCYLTSAPYTTGCNVDNPTSFPDSKFLQQYDVSIFTNSSSSSTPSLNSNRCTWATCGGQALHETKVIQSITSSTDNQSWGGDSSDFVYAAFPWFIRGNLALDTFGTGAGLWSYSSVNGSVLSYAGWRAVAGAY
jgi:hypothetical protein